jgi:Fe-S cluster assembly protein SufD
VQATSASVEKQGSVTTLLLNVGAHAVRNENTSHLIGEGADSRMFSASLLDDGREVDQRTLQNHACPRTTSDLLYKNILSGKARSVFSGLIQVAEGSHFTDAYQKCRNLLLSDEAEANSMPGLEINADQVKCSHGSTTGRIEKEELFYLRSRGIPEAPARRLIACGFGKEAVSRFDQGALGEWLGSCLDAAMDSLD